MAEKRGREAEEEEPAAAQSPLDNAAAMISVARRLSDLERLVRDHPKVAGHRRLSDALGSLETAVLDAVDVTTPDRQRSLRNNHDDPMLEHPSELHPELQALGKLLASEDVDFDDDALLGQGGFGACTAASTRARQWPSRHLISSATTLTMFFEA
jgi:hypothetical protein